MNDVYQGMIVEDRRGPIGVVQAVEQDAATGTARIIVQRNDGTQQVLSGGMFAISGNTLRIDDTIDRGMSASTTMSMPTDGFDPMRTQDLSANQAVRGQVHSASELDVAAGEDVTIPVIREEAVIRTREVERGGVRVHKTVNEREEVVEQPVYREDVQVERIPVGSVITAVPEVREEGDTLIIPVVEEMLVVEKRLVLKEELRITKRRTQETEQARVILREEQVQIEPIDERQAGL